MVFLDENIHHLQLQKIKKAWQVPILPGGFPPSTFSVYGLNFQVRNVSGCTPVALLTKLISIRIDIQNYIVKSGSADAS